jgi:Zn-dependent peptidase ImmA (M78 family)
LLPRRSSHDAAISHHDAVAGKHTNIGAKRARETRAELGVGSTAPIGCLLSVVEGRLGVPVVLVALPDGIAGCCWRLGADVVLWVNGLQAPVRQRFTLAHELGHVHCGHDGTMAVDTFETLAGRTTDAREVQANAFAAELLAPADGVRALLDGEPTLDDVVLVAARFGISTIAALYRLNTLGLAPRYERLRREIDDGLHEEVWERLGPVVVADAISSADPRALPRLSPALAGSALAAMIGGAASVADAATAAGCDPRSLAAAAAVIVA